MYLNEALQTGLYQLETAAAKALQHQCSAAKPAQLLYSAVAVTGCEHKPAIGHFLEPPTENKLLWYEDCCNDYFGIKTAMASTADSKNARHDTASAHQPCVVSSPSFWYVGYALQNCCYQSCCWSTARMHTVCVLCSTLLTYQVRLGGCICIAIPDDVSAQLQPNWWHGVQVGQLSQRDDLKHHTVLHTGQVV